MLTVLEFNSLRQIGNLASERLTQSCQILFLLRLLLREICLEVAVLVCQPGNAKLCGINLCKQQLMMVQSIPRIDEIDRERTRVHVEHNFSAHVMAEKYTQIYEKVMAINKEASRHAQNEATRHKGTTASSVRAT
jgi:hypothetical protein